MSHARTKALHVTVYRDSWLRGEGEDSSYLLRISDGMMCCLGFACFAAGHTRKQILGKATPREMERYGRCLLPNYRNPAMNDAMMINDDDLLADEQREARLIETLAHIGIELTFIDGSMPPEVGNDVSP